MFLVGGLSPLFLSAEVECYLHIGKGRPHRLNNEFALDGKTQSVMRTMYNKDVNSPLLI